ncbi:hypothetical protein [Ornithinimicrobium sp. Y1694]|uniref:hypothetical protein n=1 Tax=Ornithinimicrobium sp. Y1694 TaxID=3418590 RepID=UPI003CFA0920
MQMSVEDADNAADVLVGCVDTSSLMADSFAEDDTMTEEEQACMLEAFNDDALKKMFSLLFQGKEQEATADLMGPVMSCMMQGESMWGDDMSGEVGGDAASATVPPAPSMSDLSGGGDEDADPDAPGGQNNPLGLGDEFEVGDWTVKVNSVEEDATETILAENQFNEPPSEGNQFMLVNIDATYNGDTSGTAYWDLRPTFVTGTGNTAGGQLSDMCGSYPGNLMYEGEQFPGSTVTGNLCVSFPSDQVDGAMMITEVMDFDNNDRVFVELN